MIASSVARGAGIGKRLWQALLIALALEIGLFLVLFPWSEAWDRNRAVVSFGFLRPLLLSYYLRGAVSGLGMINLWVAISQARELSKLRRQPRLHQP